MVSAKSNETAGVAPSIVPALLSGAVVRWKQHIVPLTINAVLVLAVYGAARLAAIAAFDADQLILNGLLDFVGLVAGSMVAIVWYRNALGIVRTDTTAGWKGIGTLLLPIASSSAFFWAGVLLGLRYLFGVAAIFVVIWYGLYGFFIVDGQRSPLKALGRSIAVAQGRRGAVAVLALALLVLNLVAALPIGYDSGPVGIGAAYVLLTVSSSISMLAGADLYQRLLDTERAVTQ